MTHWEVNLNGSFVEEPKSGQEGGWADDGRDENTPTGSGKTLIGRITGRCSQSTFIERRLKTFDGYPRLTSPGTNEVQEVLRLSDSVSIWSRKAVTVAVVRVQNWPGYWMDER